MYFYKFAGDWKPAAFFLADMPLLQATTYYTLHFIIMQEKIYKK